MGKLVARIILVACAYMRVPKGYRSRSAAMVPVRPRRHQGASATRSARRSGLLRKWKERAKNGESARQVFCTDYGGWRGRRPTHRKDRAFRGPGLACLGRSPRAVLPILIFSATPA